MDMVGVLGVLLGLGWHGTVLRRTDRESRLLIVKVCNHRDTHQC